MTAPPFKFRPLTNLEKIGFPSILLLTGGLSILYFYTLHEKTLAFTRAASMLGHTVTVPTQLLRFADQTQRPLTPGSADVLVTGMSPDQHGNPSAQGTVMLYRTANALLDLPAVGKAVSFDPTQIA